MHVSLFSCPLPHLRALCSKQHWCYGTGHQQAAAKCAVARDLQLQYLFENSKASKPSRAAQWIATFDVVSVAQLIMPQEACSMTCSACYTSSAGEQLTLPLPHSSFSCGVTLQPAACHHAAPEAHPYSLEGLACPPPWALGPVSGLLQVASPFTRDACQPGQLKFQTLWCSTPAQPGLPRLHAAACISSGPEQSGSVHVYASQTRC